LSAVGHLGAVPGISLASGVAPRTAWLTDALLAPPDLDVAPADLACLRDELTRDLCRLAADLPPAAHLHVDTFSFLIAQRDPARCRASEDAFVPSPGRSRRAVGLAAVNRCVRGLSAGPAAAVADVLADGLEDAAAAAGSDGVRAPWWAPWYAGLARGSRAVVAAEAVTWATQLLTAVDWGRIARPVIGGRDEWWPCPGEPRLVLRGRADVRIFARRRPALLVVGTGRCQGDWRLALGYPALVAALVRDAHAAPGRVVGVWPQSGQVRVLSVDTAMLRATARACVAAVATWIDGGIEAARPSAGTEPGTRTASVDGLRA
jgi:hypothetical protein